MVSRGINTILGCIMVIAIMVTNTGCYSLLLFSEKSYSADVQDVRKAAQETAQNREHIYIPATNRTGEKVVLKLDGETHVDYVPKSKDHIVRRKNPFSDLVLKDFNRVPDDVVGTVQVKHRQQFRLAFLVEGGAYFLSGYLAPVLMANSQISYIPLVGPIVELSRMEEKDSSSGDLVVAADRLIRVFYLGSLMSQATGLVLMLIGWNMESGIEVSQSKPSSDVRWSVGPIGESSWGASLAGRF
jgi:hypothetical protein